MKPNETTVEIDVPYKVNKFNAVKWNDAVPKNTQRELSFEYSIIYPKKEKCLIINYKETED